ncbi:helix-turn-helix transcriptional regulator [Paenibacillus solisilvae]|uniref:Helix-turn-helix transcriptional regulator n=1 Tax=Paenibacillus solisilvae TaxID=2486751 RepID=A0ABW0W0M7_9BACL
MRNDGLKRIGPVRYEPGKWDKECQLWPVRAGSGMSPAEAGLGRNRADCFGLYAVQKGSLQLIRADRRLKLQAGDLYCRFPEASCTHYKAGQEEPELIYVEIGGPGAERLLGRAGFTRGNPIFRQAESARTDRALYSILELMMEAPSQSASLPYLMQSLLYKLFADLIHRREDGSGEQLPDCLRCGLTHMDLHAPAGITVREAAEAAGVNRSHFTAEFTRRMGITPAAYLTRSRINQAKRLLAETTASVTEIAYAVGYPSLYTFSRAFKKECSLSPSSYRSFPIRKGTTAVRSNSIRSGEMTGARFQI